MDRLDDPTTNRYFSGEELRQRLDPAPTWRIADCGSGTGRFSDEFALIVETVFAVDIDPAMHAYYHEKGLPASVTPVLADMAAERSRPSHRRLVGTGYQSTGPEVRDTERDWSISTDCIRQLERDSTDKPRGLTPRQLTED
ncbi:MAG: class I SAM-dependent methyltransferase [Halobacteriales archaeon]